MFLLGRYSYGTSWGEKNWHDAKKFCKHISGDLVSIVNQEENEKILKDFNQISKKKKFWTQFEQNESENESKKSEKLPFICILQGNVFSIYL